MEKIVSNSEEFQDLKERLIKDAFYNGLWLLTQETTTEVIHGWLGVILKEMELETNTRTCRRMMNCIMEVMSFCKKEVDSKGAVAHNIPVYLAKRENQVLLYLTIDSFETSKCYEMIEVLNTYNKLGLHEIQLALYTLLQKNIDFDDFQFTALEVLRKSKNRILYQLTELKDTTTVAFEWIIQVNERGLRETNK